MTIHVLYVESSALVKLVIPEAESIALRAALSEWRRLVSGALIAVEVPRAVRRFSLDRTMLARVEAVLDDVTLISIEQGVLRTAATLLPTSVRSLDAIHLASALALGDDLGGLVTYDERLAEAARTAGVSVLQLR